MVSYDYLASALLLSLWSLKLKT